MLKETSTCTQRGSTQLLAHMSGVVRRNSDDLVACAGLQDMRITEEGLDLAFDSRITSPTHTPNSSPTPETTLRRWFTTVPAETGWRQ